MSSSASTGPTTSRSIASVELFPGIEDVLLALKGEGRLLGLVSAKRRSTVELAFAATASVTCSTSSSAATRPPTRSRRPTCCCWRSRVWVPRRSEAVYVGDSPFDIAAAKAGGLGSIGVTWGGVHDRALLEAADCLVDSPGELLGVV